MDLSVLIPARNEMFLARTVLDVLTALEADTEIIAVLDGAWAEPPVRDDPRVTLLYHPVSVGQRAATNEAAKIARGEYVMKLDAHCSVGQGFDRIMLEDFRAKSEDDEIDRSLWTMVPAMKNLHAFDWVCKDCGHRRYQGKSGPCPECGGEEERDVVWIAKPSPYSTAMRFDRDLRFKYWGGYKKRQNGRGDLVDTMSLLGACWMLSRERYFQLDICDEAWGSWGQQGTEVACKTWLSGGRLVCNKRTWFAHLFRTQGGDFGFPYPISGRQVNNARKKSREMFLNDKWSGQIYPLSWLLNRFWPVPGWDDADLAELTDFHTFSAAISGATHPLTDAANSLDSPIFASNDPGVIQGVSSPTGVTSGSSHILGVGDQSKVVGVATPIILAKAILYYTDNRLCPCIMDACQRQLEKAGLPIVSVSLKPMDFGHNVVVDGERGPETMFRQILVGLEAIEEEVGADVTVFFAEHDVLYHPSHFQFTPPERDKFWYNQNVWKVDKETGRALFHYSNHTSQLCAALDVLLEHYRERVRRVAELPEGDRNRLSKAIRRIGFEPGTHGREERVDDRGHGTWTSEVPNVDIRHKRNLTKTRWDRDQFRNQRYTEGWTEADEVPGWGVTKGRFGELLFGIAEIGGDCDD